MRKLLVLIISVLAFGCLTGATISYADTVTTDIYMPTQYLEYYALSSPVDFAMQKTSSTTYAIAEANKIIIYRDGLFSVYPLTGFNISRICFYDDEHLLFINDNNIYSLNISNALIETSQRIFDTGVDAQQIATANGRVIALKTKTFYDYESTLQDGNVVLSNPNTFAQTKDNIVGLTLIDSKTWLYVSEGKLYKLIAEGGASPEFITDGLGIVRYNTYNDGVYYFTSPDGIYSVNVETKQLSQLSNVSSQLTLGTICDPKGIFYDNDSLYVCDATLNAVCQFDLTNNRFTDFAISERADLDNRISFSATDIKTDGNNLYVLDGNKIKIFNSGKALPSLTVKLPGAFSDFAVIDDDYLITNGSSLYYAKPENGALIQKNIVATLPDLDRITTIISYGESFYFTNNYQVLSNEYTQIYRIDGNDLSTVTLVKELQGVVVDACADIFGKFYLIVKDGAKYKVQSFLPTDAQAKVDTLFETQHSLISIVADFNCNVYALSEANNIFRIDAQNSANNLTFDIVTSKNIPSTHVAKDLLLMPATNELYALYNGFILKLNSTEIDVASPENIAVPNDFEITFKHSFDTVTVKTGAKVFEIDLTTDLGQTFDYSGYTSYVGDESFILLYSDARYAIIANDGLTAIVRNQDLLTHATDKTQSGKIGFAVTNGHVYTHPVLDACFRIREVSANAQVVIVDTFIFNGTTFATVTIDNVTGFMPLSMLKTNVASDGSPYQFETKQVGKRGATVYTDQTLTTVLTTIEAFESVTIYDQTDTLYLVKIGDTFGYIQKEAIGSKGKIVVRNIALLSAVAISFIVTAIFILKRFVFSKKEIE